ncbi:nucleoside triphosphate pyrophosphohydrolase [Paraglaciecola hydrolytica]|uniref:Nucleoside triphosphate pyrophosphohydrolase n=1 Tax=Paraglaciecola hydrolytica TaxID=1799789 RepID=A0A148KMB5_9ALTE|nr:nucleoside triphosphate pyrophosphohydrolase [Paraglaciecola hydrolytica]KXI27388.1 nucleoside triphosphate hydrolase [Paraglaciecola hydrolytica]
MVDKADKAAKLNAESLADLLKTMQVLRDPLKGCAWDKQQTFVSIVPHTIEEAYEVADAIVSGDMAAIKDELGDLLFQVVFYAQLAKEQNEFDFAGICEQLNSKLIRRHPHVFAQSTQLTTTELNQQWEHIKAQERAGKQQDTDASILANIPKGMAPLQRAQKIQKKCSAIGFDWSTLPPVVDKIHEEIQEVLDEVNAPQPNQQAIEEEIGDLLFAVVNLARHAKVDAETALIKANQKFEKRFRAVETILKQQGQGIEAATLEEMEAAWQTVKKQ